MPVETAIENKMVFRKTNAAAGRHISVTPANSTNRHLSYGRIILNPQLGSVAFQNGGQETGFIVLTGSATVTVDGQAHPLVQYDGIYIPRDSSIEVRSTGVDIAEFSSDVAEHYPLQVARYAEISQNGSLSFNAGALTSQRRVNIVLGKNVDAGRLVAGFTFVEPGNWASWPPHEHGAMLEEMYVYFNMPDPAFAIQMVYNNTQYPELVTVVRDGDAVLMPSGYHPNVTVPGHRMCFLWAMAAVREKEDRQFGVVNVQQGFNTGGSGLEASRK
jgi:5-deoxy-glucuronate isomerase